MTTTANTREGTLDQTVRQNLSGLPVPTVLRPLYAITVISTGLILISTWACITQGRGAYTASCKLSETWRWGGPHHGRRSRRKSNGHSFRRGAETGGRVGLIELVDAFARMWLLVDEQGIHVVGPQSRPEKSRQDCAQVDQCISGSRMTVRRALLAAGLA